MCADHRRKWDRAYFEKLADQRSTEELEALRNARTEKETSKRQLLKAREYTVSLFYVILTPPPSTFLDRPPVQP